MREKALAHLPSVGRRFGQVGRSAKVTLTAVMRSGDATSAHVRQFLRLEECWISGSSEPFNQRISDGNPGTQTRHRQPRGSA